jgi:hypothetical protein
MAHAMRLNGRDKEVTTSASAAIGRAEALFNQKRTELVMVKLNEREEKLVNLLEERVAILTARMNAAQPQDLPWVRQERSAIVWALQVVAQARAAGCEEVFAGTFAREKKATSWDSFRNSVAGCIHRTKERAAAEATRKETERRSMQAERRREATLKWRAEAAAILDEAAQVRLRLDGGFSKRAASWPRARAAIAGC